jgi:hypothetical protein
VTFTKRLREGVRRGEITTSIKVAKHGPGENVYLVRFHYIGPTRTRSTGKTPGQRVAARRTPKRR